MTTPPFETVSQWEISHACHSEPFTPVTLSETKGLEFWLRINSVKNLTQSVILNEVKDLGSSFALLRTGFG
jgi:hypothetical protein